MTRARRRVVPLLADGLVHLAPPHVSGRARLVDDELVLGRASRVLAGLDHERAPGRDEALVIAHGGLVEHGDRQVGMDEPGGEGEDVRHIELLRSARAGRSAPRPGRNGDCVRVRVYRMARGNVPAKRSDVGGRSRRSGPMARALAPDACAAVRRSRDGQAPSRARCARYSRTSSFVTIPTASSRSHRDHAPARRADSRRERLVQRRVSLRSPAAADPSPPRPSAGPPSGRGYARSSRPFSEIEPTIPSSSSPSAVRRPASG